MRRSFLLIAYASLTGCSTLKEMQHKGFATELLLAEEKASWGQSLGVWDWPTRAKDMNVPLNARPIGIRELHCRRESELYDCDYLVDYGREQRIEGTYKHRNELIGKDTTGKWSLGWIVVT